MTAKMTTLPNGLRVVTDTMSGACSASMRVHIGAGSRSDPPGLPGVAHFLEHLSFRRPAGQRGRDVIERIEARGGDINAGTGRDVTEYTARVLAADLPLAIDTLAAIVAAPEFTPDDLEQERRIVLQEIGQSGSQIDDVVHDMAWRLAFPHCGLGAETLGSGESVCGMRAEHVMAFRSSLYCANNMVVAAAGAVDHDDFVSAIWRSLFGHMDEGAVAPQRSTAYVGGQRHEERDAEHVAIHLAFAGVASGGPRKYAAWALAQVLAGSMSSRLMRRAREERGLCYEIGAWTQSFVDTGLFSISSSTEPGNVSDLIGVVSAELRSIQDDGISAEELDRVRSCGVAATLMASESVTARSDDCATTTLDQGHPVSHTSIAAHLAAVTAADVQSAAREMLCNVPTVALAGPVSERDAMAAADLLRGV